MVGGAATTLKRRFGAWLCGQGNHELLDACFWRIAPLEYTCSTHVPANTCTSGSAKRHTERRLLQHLYHRRQVHPSGSSQQRIGRTPALRAEGRLFRALTHRGR